jgi:hypothetical protein
MNLSAMRSGRVAILLTTMFVLVLPAMIRHTGMKAATCVMNPVVINNADSGAGSLRQAILDACDGSTITFADTLASPITLTTADLKIDKNVTIQGLGANALSISGNHAVRVFTIGSVNPAIDVTISGLTITAGKSPDNEGAGIFNNSTGTLSITDSTITANDGNNGFGGGIYNLNTGTVNIANCTISANIHSSGGGAGIYNYGGTISVTNSIISNNGELDSQGGGIYNSSILSVVNSTISGNQASQGGGIFSDAFGTATVINSTISGNLTFEFGGGIFTAGVLTVTGTTFSGNGGEGVFGGGLLNDGTTQITNCTFSGNKTDGGSGSGIFHFFSQLNITNSTIAGNGSGVVRAVGTMSGTIILENTIIALNHPDVFGTFVSQGHNLIGNADGSTGFTNGVNGDQVGSSGSPVNPRLAPLEKNGGPTLTMALLPGSPAIDAGDDSVLGSPLFLTADQRGQGFPRKVGPHVDIGAFEVQADACLKDDSSGDVFQFSSMTGQYQFTRCLDGFTLSGTGVVGLADGILTLTDSERHLRVNAELDTGRRTGSAIIRIKMAPGGRQTFRINSTNPSAVCSC